MTRHPNDVYASSLPWNYWYRWPDRPAHGGMGVVAYWNRIASSWSQPPKSLEPWVVKYEDLVSESFPFPELEGKLGLSVSPGRAMDQRGPG